jgi:hypothetical protein
MYSDSMPTFGDVQLKPGTQHGSASFLGGLEKATNPIAGVLLRKYWRKRLRGLTTARRRHLEDAGASDSEAAGRHAEAGQAATSELGGAAE